jgi:hypothetical protein
MKVLQHGISSVLLTILFITAAAAQEAQPPQMAKPGTIPADRSGLQIVGNGEVAAMLSSGKTQERITGRVSISMRSSPEGARSGYVEVSGFNILFTGVSQDLLGQKEESSNPLGMLGFALQSGKKQRLRYDARSGRATGELRMYMDASWLSRYARPEGDGKDDAFLTPTVPVTVSVQMDLGKAALDKPAEEFRRIPVSLNVQIAAKETRFDKEKIVVPRLDFKFIKPAIFEWELAPIFWFEVAQRLCVQPVRILRINWFPWLVIQQSGIGLAFGEPGARTQWKKADVTFDIRDWKTTFAPSHWELSESEADALRDDIEDDDCIEVFFVNSLSPDDLWGGGATFGSGTASAQIISSDDNARHNIDFTHLGHELGHVLGLRHPNAAATASAVPASTGTLMCPSGFMNDNPTVNSQENENLLQNPLLTFSLKVISPGPDCLDSADCGACP